MTSKKIIAVLCLLASSNARILKGKKGGKKNSYKAQTNATNAISCTCNATDVDVSNSNCFEIPGSVVVCVPYY